MRELVRLAEVREGRARQSMADLLKSRSTLYEASAVNSTSEAGAQSSAASANASFEARPQSSADASTSNGDDAFLSFCAILVLLLDVSLKTCSDANGSKQLQQS